MRAVFGCGRFLTVGAPKPEQIQLAKNAYLMTIPCLVIAAFRGCVRIAGIFRRMRS